MREFGTMRRVLSLLLCAVLVCGMLPVPARAAEEDPCTHTYENGVCTVCSQDQPADNQPETQPTGGEQHEHTPKTVYSASGTEGKHTVTTTCETCSDLNEVTEADHTAATDASCESPALCVCGAAMGDPLGHSYENGKCTVCGGADPVHEHTAAAAATCMELAVCACGERFGELAAHDYVDGVCSVCEAVEHVHDYTGDPDYAQKDASVHTVTKACPDCPEEKTETAEEAHTYTDGVCVCGAQEEKEPEKLLYPGCDHHDHDENCGGQMNACTYICETCVSEIQAMVDALPAMNEINEENKNQVGESLTAIQQRYILISTAAMAEINFVKFEQAALAASSEDPLTRIALQKQYLASEDAPQATLTFVNTATNTPASLIPVGSTVAVTSAQPVSNGAAQEFYLPAGTYTVVETVEGDWDMSMTVNGAADDDHTFTATAGGSYDIALTNTGFAMSVNIQPYCSEYECYVDVGTLTILDNNDNVYRTVAFDEEYGCYDTANINNTGTYTIQFGAVNPDYICDIEGNITFTVDTNSVTFASDSITENEEEGYWAIPFIPYSGKSIQIYGYDGVTISIKDQYGSAPKDMQDNAVTNRELHSDRPCVWNAGYGTYTITATLPSNYYTTDNSTSWTLISNRDGSIDETNSTLPLTPYYDVQYHANLENIIRQKVGVKVQWADDITNKFDITVQLLKDNANEGSAVTLSSSNSYAHTFDNLVPSSKDNQGKVSDCAYTVKITSTVGNTYQTSITGSEADGYTINVTQDVPVTGVSLNKSNIILDKGGSDTLTATVEPDTATDKTVTWTSSDNAVATVDQNGKVKAVASGEEIITVTSNSDKTKTATCNVHVHGWTNYVKSDTASNTIEVKCAIGNCTESAGTVTLNAPTQLAYDGYSKDAYLSFSDNWNTTVTKPTVEQITYNNVQRISCSGKDIEASLTLGTAEVTVSYKIQQKTLTVTVPGEKTGLTYNGTGRELVDDGEVATPGEMQYRLSEADSWSTDVPTATNAGKYTVYWQVSSDDDNYTFDVKNGSVNVEIKPAEITVSGIEAENRAYAVDDNGDPITTATLNFDEVVLTGKLDADELTVTATGTFEDGNAGEDKTVNITGLTLGGTKAGNYALATSGQQTSTTATISNASQTAPTIGENGVQAVAETIDGKNDGKITGVNNTMEYRKDGETDYTEITGTEVTNLADGTYYVRVAATTNYDPSDDVSVTVSAGRKLNVTLPQTQVGYTLTSSSATVSYNGSVTLTYTLAEGYTEGENFAVTATVGTVAKNKDGTYTISGITADTAVSVSGIADTTAPNVKITVSTHNWVEFLEQFTFGLFFKESQTVTITVEEEGSGLAGTWYYLSSEVLTEDAVKALEDSNWTAYNGKFNIDPDNKYVVYAKSVDNAGNSTYISSNGLVLDETPPVITNVDQKITYYTTQKVTATDVTAGLNSLTYKIGENGTPVDIEATGLIPGNVDATYIITGADNAGNSTTLTVTMKSISTLEDNLPTETTVKPTDKDTIQDVKDKVTDILNNQSDNATEEEKKALQDILDQCDKLLDMIKDAADVTDLIDKLPKPSEVEPDDKETIDSYNQAKDAYDKLPDSVKNLIDADTKKKLEEVGKALTAYDIIHQSAKYHTKGSGKTLKFTANGYFGKFVRIEIDGLTVNASNYTAKSGSTIITLKSSYLDSLNVGRHYIRLVYTDGETDGTDSFRITISDGNPFTGDDTNIMLYGGVAVTSLLCMAMMVMFIPRKKGKYQH